MRDGSTLWTASYYYSGCNCNSQIHSLTLGADGNLYATMYWGSYTGTARSAFVGVDYRTGAKIFDSTLNTGISTTYGYTGVDEVMPTAVGDAVLDHNTVRFFDATGHEDAADYFPVPTGSGNIIQAKANTANGRVYILTTGYVSGVGDVNAVYYKDMGNSTVSPVSLPSGYKPVDIFTTPAGGVVINWTNGSDKGFSYINANGTTAYQQSLMAETGAIVVTPLGGTVVDSDGNVIVRRAVDQYVGSSDRNIVIDSFNSSGSKTRLFTSATLGGPSLDSFASTNPLLQSVANNKLYVVLCHITGSYTNVCTTTNNPSVQVISTTASTDYPRSYTLGTLASEGHLVALGDSFSSGEGVPDFISPSDSDACDRSMLAYSVQVAFDMGYHLDAFRACSGAQTADLYTGKNTEPGQLDALNAATDIVTLTVGGNDIYFSNFATTCVDPSSSCDTNSISYQTAMFNINTSSLLPDKLADLYADIAQKAPNAKVYVLGYPMIIPPASQTPYAGSCAYLDYDEKVAIHSVIDGLNSAIATATNDAGSNFTYVDPTGIDSSFVGHELCTADPYINGVDALHSAYSFHPNANGQAAYASLLETALAL